MITPSASVLSAVDTNASVDEVTELYRIAELLGVDTVNLSEVHPRDSKPFSGRVAAEAISRRLLKYESDSESYESDMSIHQPQPGTLRLNLSSSCDETDTAGTTMHSGARFLAHSRRRHNEPGESEVTSSQTPIGINTVHLNSEGPLAKCKQLLRCDFQRKLQEKAAAALNDSVRWFHQDSGNCELLVAVVPGDIIPETQIGHPVRIAGGPLNFDVTKASNDDSQISKNTDVTGVVIADGGSGKGKQKILVTLAKKPLSIVNMGELAEKYDAPDHIAKAKNSEV